MPTVEEIQKEHPDIKFTITKHFPDDILTIEHNGIFVDMSFDCYDLDMKMFNERILNPCLNHINKRANPNA